MTGITKCPHKTTRNSVAYEVICMDFPLRPKINRHNNEVSVLKGTVPPKITKFLRLPYFHVLSPNAIKYTKKDCIEQNRSSSFEVQCRIARMEVDYSSSKLISRQAIKKSKLPFLWNFAFLAFILTLWLIFLCFQNVWRFFLPISI